MTFLVVLHIFLHIFRGQDPHDLPPGNVECTVAMLAFVNAVLAYSPTDTSVCAWCEHSVVIT